MQPDSPINLRKRFVTGGIIAAFALLAGVWSALQLRDRPGQFEDLGATRFPVAREIAPFELLDQQRRPFTNASLEGVWSFLFFGYTHCPDVCPTTLGVLNSMAQRLGAEGRDVRFVFVSVDPERDTPEQLGRFLGYFNTDFIGVTGTPAAIEQLTGQLGVLHMRVDAGEDATGYLVDHTAGVILVDPDARYHAVFMPPLSAAGMLDDFSRIRAAYR